MRLPLSLRLDPGGSLGKLATAIQDLLSRTNGQVNRNTDKASEWISVKDAGPVGDGTTNASPAFTDMFAAAGGDFRVPAGTYSFSSNVQPAARDFVLRVDPTAVFTGSGKLRLDDVLPYQNDPIFSNDVERKDYGASFDGYANIFQHARHAKGSTTVAVPVVAYYGVGEAGSANSRAFGANFSGFVAADGGRATGIEVDCGYRNGATTGHAYGVTLVAAGAVACDTAITIQSNDSAAQFGNGINFSFNASASSGAVSGAAIRLGSNSGAASCQRFLYATSDMSATSAEIDLPSFRVEATAASVVNRVSILGGATGVSAKIRPASSVDTDVSLEVQGLGTGVVILKAGGNEVFRGASTSAGDSLEAQNGTGVANLKVRGSSTNADVAVIGKGSGGVKLADGGGTTRVQVNTTGIGFYGTAPVAKPAVTGSRGGNAALASLLTQLASLGLITDSSTA